MKGELEIVEEAALFFSHPIRKHLLVDVANYKGQEAFRWFLKRWFGRIRPEFADDLIQIRDGLRAYGSIQNCQRPMMILNKWLGWFPSAEEIEIYEECNLLNYVDRKTQRLFAIPLLYKGVGTGAGLWKPQGNANSGRFRALEAL